MRGFTHTVKDPLWGNIPMTKEIRDLLSAGEVEKLSRIKQNGPACHIYPGAVHTRLSHSLGVYYIGRAMMMAIAQNDTDLPFTQRGLMSFLVACLLHDIGHFPYAHSLKELSVREHEEIARSLINGQDELSAAIRRTGADPEMTGLIIDTSIPSSSPETDFYRSVLSGTLDPDKLDYLSRDAFFAGIPYGSQDTSYIIASLSFASGRLVLQEDALSLVEQVLFSKYMMYRNLYWHKGVRGATAMIKRAVLSALQDDVIRIEDLYMTDDSSFLDLIHQHDGYAPFDLIWRVEHGRIEERKAWKAYDGKGIIEQRAGDIRQRWKLEKDIFSALSPLYPELEEHEVIIDIPEPISFETKIGLLMEDGSICDGAEDTLFPEAGALFSRKLRKAALYLPQYVRTEDAQGAFREASHG